MFNIEYKPVHSALLKSKGLYTSPVGADELLSPSYTRSSRTLCRCLWLQTLPERSDENWPNRPVTSPHEEHQSETSASPVDDRQRETLFYNVKHINVSHKSLGFIFRSKNHFELLYK